jgi:hypothetical protein
VRSVTFSRLGWVLLREVALRVLYPVSIGSESEQLARRGLADAQSRTVRGAVMHVLRVRPDRSSFPRRGAE